MKIILWKKACEFGQFLHSRAFAVSMLSLVLAFVVFKITCTMNAVRVIGEDGRTLAFTMENRPEELAKQFAPGEDNVVVSTVEGHYGEVRISSLMNATISADGKTIPCTVENGITVGELLYQNGITYDGNDLLTPSSEKLVADGEQIILKRVQYEEYKVEEPIPYKVIHKNSSLIHVGQNKRIQQGEEGLKTLTYISRTVDGIKEEEHLLGEQISKSPVEETILIGSPAPVSDLDFDLEVDENGRPLNFTRVLQNQVATGYSAREGAKTASGRYAVPGHVAVNPHEIPYGSKLYIVSTDNKFVYGCAVAADTGTGLMADVVDVDLFYETYQESVLNGRRYVDIYVLS